MKIGFDAKRLFHNTTGLGYYSRTLLQNLIAHTGQKLQPILFDKQPIKNELTAFVFEDARIKLVPIGKPSWYYRSIDMNKYILSETLDIFHGLSNEIPFQKFKTNTKSVVTIHDILFKEFPQDFPFLDRRVYDWKTKSAIKNADKIVVISRATQMALQEKYSISEEKIKVIYQSYDPLFASPTLLSDIQSVISSLGIPSEYLLYVGSITFRKNLKIILQALAKLPPQHRIPLVVVGDGTTYKTEIKKYIHEKNLGSLVYLFHKVERKKIKALYAGAQALIYPSLGEGFGLPVLEGIVSNTPVLTSNLSSMPEAGGTLAHYFNPTSESELAELILHLDKKKWQNDNMVHRQSHIEKFSGENVASAYLKLYQSIL